MHLPTGILLLLYVGALAVCSDMSNAQSTSVATSVTASDTASHAKPQRGYTGYTANISVVATLQGSPRVLQTSPLTVTAIAPASPAAKAGLKPGDIILAVNGIDVETVDAGDAVWPFFVGVEYVMRIRRDGADQELSIVPSAPTRSGVSPRR